ncbi:hypothetical protein ASPWEDRAFT_305187 [Aspergillus wentii DTO 134E9]|uniref:Uncharacterized protein n=1 Tax=Aspergillus wentii DTO 134E9 TaxID=1073089 RepID=A0A1L9R412_ASPWE|nr:uncharacterized protein ASPWEDRAFT_305187 [Aspergillus wentii DTO 134E9]OJJ29644.1 hypothetical protein ASPWEDRAFT_305187 [Aspergillus wentii DTO 134E9]
MCLTFMPDYILLKTTSSGECLLNFSSTCYLARTRTLAYFDMETATEQEREALAIIPRAGSISSAARVDKTTVYAFEWTGFGVAFLLCSGQIALRLAFSRCLRAEDGLTLLALVFLLVLAIIVTLEIDPLYELLGSLSGESSLTTQLNETPKQSARLSNATNAANLISWSCVCTVKMCSLVCFWRAVRPMKVMVQRLWILFWAIVAFTVISYGVNATGQLLGGEKMQPCNIPPLSILSPTFLLHPFP